MSDLASTRTPSRWLRAELPLSEPEAEELLRTVGHEPTPRLVAWARATPSEVFRYAGPTPESDGELVEALRKAQESVETVTAMLSRAREERRVFAELLRGRGYSYRWIGEQLGVTAQAVDGFLKHRPRESGGTS